MSERVEAAAKAMSAARKAEYEWGTRLRSEAQATLDAADAVMFSEEAIERAAEAAEASGILPSNGNDQQDRNAATGIVRAVVVALRGEA